jgi:hypothetical protein
MRRGRGMPGSMRQWSASQHAARGTPASTRAWFPREHASVVPPRARGPWHASEDAARGTPASTRAWYVSERGCARGRGAVAAMPPRLGRLVAAAFVRDPPARPNDLQPRALRKMRGSSLHSRLWLPPEAQPTSVSPLPCLCHPRHPAAHPRGSHECGEGSHRCDANSHSWPPGSRNCAPAASLVTCATPAWP